MDNLERREVDLLIDNAIEFMRKLFVGRLQIFLVSVFLSDLQ